MGYPELASRPPVRQPARLAETDLEGIWSAAGSPSAVSAGSRRILRAPTILVYTPRCIVGPWTLAGGPRALEDWSMRWIAWIDARS